MYRFWLILHMLWITVAVNAFDLSPPGNFVGYVTGDRGVKLAWEVTSPSNDTVFELRWRANSDESFMVVSGTTNNVTVRGLRLYTQYFFRIRKGLVNGTWGGFTKYTHVWTPEGVPTAPPANVTAYNTSSMGIIVFWEQIPRYHRNGYILGYKVCYKRADTNNSVLYCTAVFALGLELGGLQPYTPYWITVLGYNNQGEGPTSQPQQVWTDEFVPSVAPKITSLTTNSTAIRVAWDPIPKERVNGVLRGYYVIYWRMPRVSQDNHVIQVNQTTLRVVIVGLKRNTSYGVQLTGLTRVRGYIRNGVLSRTQKVTTKYGSKAPKNLRVFSLCSTCLTVTWDPVYISPTDSLKGYHVTYRGTSGKAHTKKIGARKSIAQLKNLKKFSTYTVTVTAKTDEGLGDTSASVTVTTMEDVPSRSPISMRVRSTGAHSILIEWSPVPRQYVHGVLRGYQVYYRAGRPMIKRSVSQMGVIKAVSVNKSIQSVEITSLEPFTPYDVWVSAYTAAGSGPPSRPVTVTTDEDVPSRAPRILEVFAKSPNSVFVKWEPIPQHHVKGLLQGYHVHYSQIDTSYPVLKNVITVNESVAHVTLDNTKPLTRYRVWITGFTKKGSGPSSDKTFVSTPQTVPGSPQGVKVSIENPQSVLITWRSHSSFTKFVTRYMVKWLHVGSTADSRMDGHKIVNAGNPYRRETQVGGLKPHNMYSFMVREETGQNNWGKFSDPVDVIMPEDAPSPPRRISVKYKEKTRLVLQWRRPEETNGVLRKYELHFTDGDQVTKTYTVDTDVDKEYVTYEMTLPDVEAKYKIKVQAYNSKQGQMSDEITVQHSPSVQTSEARVPTKEPSLFKSKLVWIIAGVVGFVFLLVVITTILLLRRDARRSKKKGGDITKRTLSIISQTARPRRPVPVKELAEHCAHFHDNNNALFNDEFKCLDRLAWKSTWEASQVPHNRTKNRYCNVVAYDHSRVVLTAKRDIPGSDYINANYVDGYSFPAKYIATQGPIESTVNDFWRMVWEKNVKTIIMIEMLGRDEDSPCERYWSEAEPKEYGHVAVSLLSSMAMSDWTIRDFMLWSTDPDSVDKREVVQYHFTSWPDHSVPRDTIAFLMFHHKLKTTLVADPGPVIIHCSAGVGRTGSFIAIDSLMEQMDTEKVVDVYGFVAQMRKQRNYMVQTEEQYRFIYDVLRDASICGVTTITSSEFGSDLLCVSGDEPEVVEQRTLEFESLQDYSAHETLFREALFRENALKNRSPEMLPFNHNRVYLKPFPDDPCSDYINASLIDSYNEGAAYIATQGPMPSTVNDFWHMLWEQRSTVVVMLTDLRENGVEQCYRYWPEEEEGCAKYGKIRVTKIDEEVLEDHTQRVFKVRRHGGDESLVVYHFQCHGWKENGLPRAESLVYLQHQVHKVEPGEYHNGPIIVHCSNGDGRTGVFLSLCLSIDRLETDDNVDIFNTVRWLRSQRAGLVSSLDQYNFCYELMKSYMAWRIRAAIKNDYV